MIIKGNKLYQNVIFLTGCNTQKTLLLGSLFTQSCISYAFRKFLCSTGMKLNISVSTDRAMGTDKNLSNCFMLYAVGVTFSSQPSHRHSRQSHPLHFRGEKSVHLYVISSPLLVSTGEQCLHCTSLIQEIIVYPKAKYHSKLQKTTFSATL